MTPKRINSTVSAEIKILAPKHTRREIATLLGLKYGTVVRHVWEHKIQCRKSKLRKRGKCKEVVRKIFISPYVLPGIKFNPATGIERDLKIKVSIDLIKNVVLNYFDIPEIEIQGPKQSFPITWARQLIHAIAYKLAGRSMALIGKEIGNRDHSTVINSCKIVKNRIETEPDKAREYREIRGIIENLLN